MSLTECQEKHTHRQYLAWLEFLEEEWNRPTKLEHYLMQIALQVASVLNAFSKKPKQLKLSQFKIEFKSSKTEPKTELTAEEFSKRALAVHLAQFGYSTKPKNRG